MAEPATELNSLKRVSIVQQVEQVIADRIVDGTYAVDTKLPAEMTLSKQLGVGRGTVREAFRLLEAKGLVEIRPGRGAFVASDKEAGTEQTVQWFRANEMELLDCVQVRNALEPLAARLMAERSQPEENDEIAAVALAVPVTLQGRSGTYLYGLCGEGSLILAGLVDYLCAQQKLRGAGFTVAVPTSPEQAALLQDKGFAWAFALRCLPREVERNLWSQAEFDSVTAKKLCELRERFWPDTVQLTPERMAVVLGDLYSSGATIVSSAHGYGIYFRKEDTLYFVELQADNDRAAEVLMEAAREKEVIVEKAVITVGASQPLFLGEGTRQDYGMIRFDAEPFDVAESYMRLMLEN